MSRFRLPGLRAAAGAATVACLTGALLLAQPLAAEAAAPSTSVSVAGYSGEQLANARVIVAVAAARRLPAAAAVLGVAAAMGESSLRNLPYGDGAINPDGTVADSVGLFQQQHWWGTKAQRMTPAYAAGAFFAHLVRVKDWERRTPTAAIHAVQGNADPSFYTRFVPAAIDVVAYVLKHPGSIPVATSAPSTATPKAASGAAHTKRTRLTIPVPEPLDLPDLPDYGSIPSSDLFDPLDQDWAAGFDLGGLGDAFSGAFLDGLGSDGGTLTGDQAPLP